MLTQSRIVVGGDEELCLKVLGLFIERFGVSTCEVGMGQEIIRNEEFTHQVCTALKYNGRLL